METGAGDPAESFLGLLSALADHADLLDGLDSGSYPASTVEERQRAVVALFSALDRIEAAVASLTGYSSEQLDHAAGGARSMHQWVTARTEADRPRVRALLGLHHDLRRFPSISAAWRAGRIGTAKVRLLLRAGFGIEDALERDQDDLLVRIEPLRVAWSRVLLARWREAVLADMECSPEERRPTDQPPNSVRYSAGVGDETNATTIMDPLHAAEFRSLVDSEIDRRFRSGEYTAGDGLTLEERRLDAQLGLMRRGALVRTEGGESKKSVILLVDFRHLLPGLDADAVERALWPSGLADGTPLSRGDVISTMLGASVTAVLGFYGVTGRFRPVGEVTSARLADASQRRLLKVRDGGCMFPGCDAPAAHCRPHHEPPFERSRRTTTDELVLLCRHHHRLRHEVGFRVGLSPAGDVTASRPDGSRIAGGSPAEKLRLPPAIAS